MDFLMETIVVTCIVVLNLGVRNVAMTIKAPAMHTDNEIWLLDLDGFMRRHERFKKYNNIVQFVNSNMCVFGDMK